MRETATLKEVVCALNNFYDEFLEQNIKVNLEHANQEDVNDGEYNKQNATKVLNWYFFLLKMLCTIFLQITVPGLPGTSYPDDLGGQRSLFKTLLDPLLSQVLGPGVDYDIYPRRGGIRNGTLPPCEVGFRL